MKKSVFMLAFVSLSLLQVARSSPFDIFKGIQDTLAGVQGYPDLASEIASTIEDAGALTTDPFDLHVANLLGVQPSAVKTTKDGKTWNLDFAGIKWKLFSDVAILDYQIRLIEHANNMCGEKGRTYSGYADISGGKHLFFWFIESAAKPKPPNLEVPTILWLDGGPGASSVGQILSGLGPCRFPRNKDQDPEANLATNPYSWHKFANIIFLDTPIGAGFSYSHVLGQKVEYSFDAAKDVYFFLQAFFRYFNLQDHQYPSESNFHIAGVSYAGKYIPEIADKILKENLRPKNIVIKLKSVALANAWTDPLIQYQTYYHVLCTTQPPPAWVTKVNYDHSCATLIPDPGGAPNLLVQACMKKVDECHRTEQDAVCSVGSKECWSSLVAPFYDMKKPIGINVNDVRLDCTKPALNKYDCSREGQRIWDFMNNPNVQRSFGVISNPRWDGFKQSILDDFVNSGDEVRKVVHLITGMLDKSVRVLGFAGKYDANCNHFGMIQWMESLDKYGPALKSQKKLDWTVFDKDITTIGEYKKIGNSGAGDYAYVIMDKAGHLTFNDQPAITAALMKSWIENTPLPDSLPGP